MAKTKNLAEAIETLLAAVKDGPDVSASERELVELGLEFANRTVLRGVLLLVPGVDMPWQMPRPDGRRSVDPNTVSVYVGHDPHYARQSAQMRADLYAILHHKLSTERRKQLTTVAQQVVLTPVYTFEGKRLRVRYHHLQKELQVTLAHILMLLMDTRAGSKLEPPGLGNELRQCALDGCDVLYLTGERDARSAKFCSDEHQTVNRRKSGAERQERYRKRHGKLDRDE